MKIVSILSQLLTPPGFKRAGGANWLRWNAGLLTRVSYYSSQFGGPGYIDIALTLSEEPILKQRAGDWEALSRLVELIPSGRKIREMIRKDVSEEEGRVIEKIFKAEALDLLRRLEDPAEAGKIVVVEAVNEYGVGIGWLKRNNFDSRLNKLVRERRENG